jgi:hypothetical protein
MPEVDDSRIPEAPPPASVPEFEYADIEKDERIGTGGDADVYRATVERGGETHTIAVKTPRFEGTVSKQVVEQFENEAETWARLDDHENIVTVYAKGIEPIPWIALEYMDGGTLDIEYELRYVGTHVGSKHQGSAGFRKWMPKNGSELESKWISTFGGTKISIYSNSLMIISVWGVIKGRTTLTDFWIIFICNPSQAYDSILLIMVR